MRVVHRGCGTAWTLRCWLGGGSFSVIRAQPSLPQFSLTDMCLSTSSPHAARVHGERSSGNGKRQAAARFGNVGGGTARGADGGVARWRTGGNARWDDALRTTRARGGPPSLVLCNISYAVLDATDCTSALPVIAAFSVPIRSGFILALDRLPLALVPAIGLPACTRALRSHYLLNTFSILYLCSDSSTSLIHFMPSYCNHKRAAAAYVLAFLPAPHTTLPSSSCGRGSSDVPSGVRTAGAVPFCLLSTFFMGRQAVPSDSAFPLRIGSRYIYVLHSIHATRIRRQPARPHYWRDRFMTNGWLAALTGLGWL